MLKLVAGKLAFVTGAGSGIGREVCQTLAREGAKIVATDQNIKTAQETVNILEGDGHIALHVQVTSEESIQTAFKDVIKQFLKPPSIIVNAAGIVRDNFIVKLSVDDFDNVINVNLKGTFMVMQTAVKAMIEADTTKGSSIINVSSIIGKHGNIGQANYSASKAGVIGMTKTACMEFGKLGIRVNAVLPGFIETPMIGGVPDNIKEMFVKRIPLQRMGKPEEVAEVIAFLASDKSSYMSGTSVEITGGMN